MNLVVKIDSQWEAVSWAPMRQPRCHPGSGMDATALLTVCNPHVPPGMLGFVGKRTPRGFPITPKGGQRHCHGGTLRSGSVRLRWPTQLARVEGKYQTICADVTEPGVHGCVFFFRVSSLLSQSLLTRPIFGHMQDQARVPCFMDPHSKCNLLRR